MLNVHAFRPDKVQVSNGNHAVVVADADSGVAVVIIRTVGSLTEVLTSDHPEFNKSLALLSAVSGIAMTPPRQTMVEGS